MENKLQDEEVMIFDLFEEIEEIVTPGGWGTIGCCYA